MNRWTRETGSIIVVAVMAVTVKLIFGTGLWLSLMSMATYLGMRSMSLVYPVVLWCVKEYWSY